MLKPKRTRATAGLEKQKSNSPNPTNMMPSSLNLIFFPTEIRLSLTLQSRRLSLSNTIIFAAFCQMLVDSGAQLEPNECNSKRDSSVRKTKKAVKPLPFCAISLISPVFTIERIENNDLRFFYCDNMKFSIIK
jgi:hypothetical protein